MKNLKTSTLGDTGVIVDDLGNVVAIIEWLDRDRNGNTCYKLRLRSTAAYYCKFKGAYLSRGFCIYLTGFNVLGDCISSVVDDLEAFYL
jgi:hypothetical protein